MEFLIKKFLKNILLLVTGYWLLVTALSGCATPSKKVPSTVYPYPEKRPVKKEGIYHRVKKGETLWRISKLYGIDLERIVAANNLADATKIYTGQLIFIPQVTSLPQETVIKEKGFIWPVKGKVISFFGLKKPDSTINRGIDILAKEESNVAAAQSGRVIFCSEKLKGLGKTIIIQHEDQLYSLYGNNSLIFVSAGQEINQGDLIARVGRMERTGDYVLHFEIRRGHVPQNPFYFLP